MPPRIRYNSALVSGIVLAKIGNPLRDEPLQTSRDVFHVGEEDCSLLTSIFLKPFRNLVGHRFSHHSSLEQHEMNTLSQAIFADEIALLEKGCDIARRLYSKSNHPNIKSGDLCIALVQGIEFNGQTVRALCILKSESVTPFLHITTHQGDLKLHTEEGINPEKIDKGCLIFDVYQDQGYYVMTFDRTSGESRFWVRDFLGLKVVTDASYLTKSFADLAVSFLEQEQAKPEGEAKADDTTPPWQATVAAREALEFFEKRDNFDLKEFEEEVLKTPEVVAKFTEHRQKFEEETGQPLDKFEISKKDLGKVKKKISSVMKLDNGVEIHLKSKFLLDPGNPTIERGFDEEKKMKYVKVYYYEESSEQA